MFINLSVFGFFNDWITHFLNVPGAHIWVYVLLGAIIFIETGLVIFPILPGDSILFFVGSMVALYPNKLSLVGLIVTMGLIAFIANVVNFEIGRKFGSVLPEHPKLSRFLKPEYMDEAHQFFKKWGSWAIFLGRFMPIIRTIVPFTAGAGKMPHKKFLFFNFIGGFAWVTVALGAGYLFGQVPFIKKNFELVMIAIVVVSLLPALLGVAKRYFEGKKA
ncbi:VTT domain-containing protein [Lactococcus fujiensis]|uniref:Cytochrome O ubiquinol oxidase n=1 Tax=Lactococcus fujiensis JCM 16395 TaxID=1291764 RepID=A0A2A5RJP7_9LACT|nr:VTT domain-containing protein [Lactococcus fujiensis]PCR99361.1 cytochrome O ubiquinol oxidase [Lactococcus fujiensis JCM 16395]